jgi:hypothetical protein
MISESQKRAIKKWRENNREKFNEYVKNWKAAHPEYKEKNNEYVKKSRAKKAAIIVDATCTIESCP